MDEKILAVDDDSAVLDTLERLLESVGYRVIRAASGEAGIELARVEHPALILLDLNLPGVDGGEMAQILTESTATADIPIIFISGLITGRDETEPGPAGYPLVAKPFERSKLLGMVRRYIRAFAARPAV